MRRKEGLASTHSGATARRGTRCGPPFAGCCWPSDARGNASEQTPAPPAKRNVRRVLIRSPVRAQKNRLPHAHAERFGGRENVPAQVRRCDTPTPPPCASTVSGAARRLTARMTASPIRRMLPGSLAEGHDAHQRPGRACTGASVTRWGRELEPATRRAPGSPRSGWSGQGCTRGIGGSGARSPRW